MKSRILGLAACLSVVALAACNDPAPYEDADAADEMAVDVVEDAAPMPTEPAAPSATDTPGPDASTLPADKRTSEETVRPESETMFY